MIDEKYIKAYAIKNAIEHKGKAAIGAVIAGLFNHGLEKGKIKEFMPKINIVIDEINSLEFEEQIILFKKYEKLIGHRKEREGLPNLPNLKKGKVITRMSPSPSGPLTLGHILTIGPNYLYVKQYGGIFYMRIEDTNPENIDPLAYKMIEEESNWLTNNTGKIIIQSDRIEIYYNYVEKLLDKEAVYVCECDTEEFKELLLKNKACPCRSKDKKEQKKRWEKMLDKGGYKQGAAVLRFKADLNDKNPAFRDFTLARINESSHPRKKNKYRVWPLMNLAVTVDDIELKMTHIVRGKDHKDNAVRQKMIYKALGKEKQYPYVAFIGKVHFDDFEMSASKMRKGILEGKYSGWDDPLLPTVATLRKKYTPQAFWNYVEDRGINEADKTISQKDFFELIDNYQKEANKQKEI
jgi:glutamyl-tRNA synthetase